MILIQLKYLTEVYGFFICLVTSLLVYECIHGEELPESLAVHATCYGDHRYQPRCSTTETVMAVKDLYVGAKTLESGCPRIVQENPSGRFQDIYTQQTINETKCCAHDASSDCTFRYETSTLQEPYKYFFLCSGLNECRTTTSAVWSDIKSEKCPNKSHLYPPNTNYMYMEIYCIEETRTFDICGSVDKSITGKPLYLYNPGYPNSLSSTYASCSCSVQSDICEDTINVYTVHVMMTSEEGACKQRLYATDENSWTLVEWNCQTQTNFNITLNTVQGRYFLINLENYLSNDGGYVWLGFKANHEEASMTINCPPVSKTICLTTTTASPTTITASTTTLTASTTTTIAYDEASSSGDSSPGEDTLSIIIGAAIGALLVLIATALAIYCYCRKKNKVDPEKKTLTDAEELCQPDYDIEKSGFELLNSPHTDADVSVPPANTHL